MGNARAQKPAAKYALVIVMMLVTLLASVAFARRPDPNVPVADLSAIPTEAGDWKLVRDIELDENTMKQMLADSFVQRHYVNEKLRQEVVLLAVYRRYGRREFAHRPELCFPAAGYQINKNENTTLFWGGREVPSKYITAFGQGMPETTITYIFASGKRAEEDFMQQQLLMAFERVMPNKNGWTFLRLTSRKITTNDAALEGQKDFMRAMAPAIEAVITTDKATSGGGDSAAVTPIAAPAAS